MGLTILQAGETVLRQVAKPLSHKDIRSTFIQTLIPQMRETMYEAPGVGLAAPQIGEGIQLLVLEDREELLQTLPAAQLAERERRPTPFQIIINPKLIIENTQQVEFFEGCLSTKGFIGLVPRYRQVKVHCLNEWAEPTVIEASGWHARILQHEIDHLNGILYLDHVRPRSLMTVDNYIKLWRDKSVACICQTLHIE